MISETQTKDLLTTTAGANYSGIDFKKHGGTRDIYFAQWGPSNELRVLKVDRPEEEITSPRAIRHVQRGYNTQHERHMAGILQRDGGHPSLNKLVDYWQLPNERAVNVYEYFGGTTLEEVVLESPLNRQEFIAIFKDVLAASKYMASVKGVAHRDIKPSNILVDRNAIYSDSRPVAQITDFTNAEEVSVINLREEQALPTVGGHLVTDPRLMQPFTGFTRRYTLQDDMYQVCSSMLFAAHGKHLFEYDPDKVKGTNHLTGESLLDSEGRFDEKKFRKVLKNAVDTLPAYAKPFKDIIWRGMI
ncbi:MAG TPA: protein kinase [Candidatus Nanoarchaeia archaeon]|nr:protein kinase [Candidatus Nanoarchaeia archaeon]